MSKFTRNIEKDKELFKLPITTVKLAGIFEAFPEYARRICELEEELQDLKDQNALLQKQVDFDSEMAAERSGVIPFIPKEKRL